MRCPCCNARDTEEMASDGMYCNDCGMTFRKESCPSCGSFNVGELDDKYWSCNDCNEKIERKW